MNRKLVNIKFQTGEPPAPRHAPCRVVSPSPLAEYRVYPPPRASLFVSINIICEILSHLPVRRQIKIVISFPPTQYCLVSAAQAGVVHRPRRSVVILKTKNIEQVGVDHHLRGSRPVNLLCLCFSDELA